MLDSLTMIHSWHVTSLQANNGIGQIIDRVCGGLTSTFHFDIITTTLPLSDHACDLFEAQYVDDHARI